MILLVEDNPEDQDLTLRAFRTNDINELIVTASDGVMALDFLFGTGEYSGRNLNLMPRLTLLDLKLPKIDGLELSKDCAQTTAREYFQLLF